MTNLRIPRTFSVLASAALAMWFALGAAAAAPKPPAVPAAVAVESGAGAVGPGDVADVVVRLSPIEGVKLNRYPKMTLSVSELPGVVGATAVQSGADSPPRPGSSVSNYWDGDSVALRVPLVIDDAAAGGDYRLTGRLQYFYCVTASGFCSRESVDVVIPLAVR